MFRRALVFVVFALLIWGGGFAAFLATIPRPGASLGDAAPNNSGVVVLTGAGGDRISTAIALVEGGVGERLLISGVNPATSKQEIGALWSGDRTIFDCCVDIDKRATTTTENAAEVRLWAKRHAFETIILVTSDYHIRRAKLELIASMPQARIIAHPVQSVYFTRAGAPASAKAWRVLSAEYAKYLAVRVKTFFA
ncbi:MAG: YdcF family protein [Pseudomonadota bacterium]